VIVLDGASSFEPGLLVGAGGRGHGNDRLTERRTSLDRLPRSLQQFLAVHRQNVPKVVDHRVEQRELDRVVLPGATASRRSAYIRTATAESLIAREPFTVLKLYEWPRTSAAGDYQRRHLGHR